MRRSGTVAAADARDHSRNKLCAMRRLKLARSSTFFAAEAKQPERSWPPMAMTSSPALSSVAVPRVTLERGHSEGALASPPPSARQRQQPVPRRRPPTGKQTHPTRSLWAPPSASTWMAAGWKLLLARPFSPPLRLLEHVYEAANSERLLQALSQNGLPFWRVLCVRDSESATQAAGTRFHPPMSYARPDAPAALARLIMLLLLLSFGLGRQQQSSDLERDACLRRGHSAGGFAPAEWAPSRVHARAPVA